MCLAIPGQIEETFDKDGLRMARVNFGGVRRSTCLEYVRDAQPGDYVLVHVGFALNVVDEEEARRTLSALAGSDELSELGAGVDLAERRA